MTLVSGLTRLTQRQQLRSAAVGGFLGACLVVAQPSHAQTSYVVISNNSQMTASALPSSMRRDPEDDQFILVDARYQSQSRRSEVRAPNGRMARLIDVSIKVDCEARKMSEIDAIYRDANGVAIDEVRRSSSAAADIPTPTGSLNSLLLNWVCVNSPPRRAGPPAPTARPAGPKEAGPRISGSAFAVQTSGRLLTNNHVVEGCSEVVVTGVGGNALVGRVLARDARNDLALISVTSPLQAIAVFRGSPIRSGEDVIALGFPLRGLLAMEMSVSKGIVNATAGLFNDTSQLQISAAVQPGNSGGPLLDVAGSVAGVVVSKLDAIAIAKVTGDIPQNVNFAIKAETAEVFLRSQDVEPRRAGSATSVTAADVVEVARRYTFLIECDPGRQPIDQNRDDGTGFAKPRPLEPDKPAEALDNPSSSPRLLRPIACSLGDNCGILSYPAHETGGSPRDYTCGFRASPASAGTVFVFTGALSRRDDIQVLAAADGTIQEMAAGIGLITIGHAGNLRTSYRVLPGSLRGGVGQTIRAGDPIGFVGKQFLPGPGKAQFSLRALPFSVMKDAAVVDPFSSSFVKAGCGKGDSMWSPDAAARLPYSAIGVFDAGFAGDKIDEVKAINGDYQEVLRADTRWIGVYAWVFGVHEADEVETTLIGPTNDVLYTEKFRQPRTVTDRVLWVAKRRAVLSSWPLGRYVGRFRIIRNGKPVLEFEKELDLR